MSIIKVKNLSAYYESRRVFENLNFDVQDGDYLCIIGENGTGKTTLMKLLLGLDVKHTGNVKFEGFTKKEIGWLPQKTQHQADFPASVKEIVMSGFAGRNFLGLFYGKNQKQQATKNMDILGIADIAEMSFTELSGGQQQKVLLCRALCAAKRVLLLDEPASSLDSAAADELYALIKKLNQNGLAIIMITHDIARAEREAKNILTLSHGGYEYEKGVK
ncbi:MAG: ATP-binding cassette domain-containing protein [Clostridia bacterium]|nr:ATP-binding cassette domain-containing protein [Clostridia bacterium]